MTPVAIRRSAVGIFAVDPGKVSGVAAGVFEVDQWESVSRVLGRGCWESWECVGSAAEQAMEIGEQFVDLRSEWNLRGVGLDSIRLVVEDFALRGVRRLSDRSALDPVRVAAGMEALLLRGDVEIEYQQPGEAMGYVTNERLRRWGVWVVGSEHRRDAVRHMVKRLAQEMK